MRSIVVPTYNEEERIEGTINELLGLGNVEIIVSDDGSSDRTVEIAKSYVSKHKNIVVVSGRHRGKGAALKRGFEVSRGDPIGFLDADLSAKSSELLKLFEIVEKEGADLAIGSRELPGSVLPVKQPIHRRALGSTYSIFARILFGLKIRDFQCGCKAFTRDLWKKIDVDADGFVFDTELIARSKAKGFRILEFPIEWSNDKRSRVDPLRDPLKMFLGLVKIRLALSRRDS